MKREVSFHDDFEAEFDALDEAVQDKIFGTVWGPACKLTQGVDLGQRLP